MAVEENKKNDEAAIQGLLDDCTRSLHDKNIEGVMSLYAPEVVSFDIVPLISGQGWFSQPACRHIVCRPCKYGFRHFEMKMVLLFRKDTNPEALQKRS